MRMLDYLRFLLEPMRILFRAIRKAPLFVKAIILSLLSIPLGFGLGVLFAMWRLH